MQTVELFVTKNMSTVGFFSGFNVKAAWEMVLAMVDLERL